VVKRKRKPPGAPHPARRPGRGALISLKEAIYSGLVPSSGPKNRSAVPVQLPEIGKFLPQKRVASTVGFRG